MKKLDIANLDGCYPLDSEVNAQLIEHHEVYIEISTGSIIKSDKLYRLNRRDFLVVLTRLDFSRKDDDNLAIKVTVAGSLDEVIKIAIEKRQEFLRLKSLNFTSEQIMENRL